MAWKQVVYSFGVVWSLGMLPAVHQLWGKKLPATTAKLASLAALCVTTLFGKSFVMLVRIDFSKLSCDSKHFASINKVFFCFGCVLAIQNCQAPLSCKSHQVYQKMACNWAPPIITADQWALTQQISIEQFAFLSFRWNAHGCFSKPFLPFSPKFSLGVGLTAVSPSLGAEPGRALFCSTLRLSLWPARRRLLRGGEAGVGVGEAGRPVTWWVRPSTLWRRGVRLLDDRFGETLFVLCGSSAEKRALPVAKVRPLLPLAK